VLLLIQNGNRDSALNLNLNETNGMQALALRFNERLKTCKYYLAFESELDRVWPYERKQRQKCFDAIQAFAARNGWSAKILDPGIRVTFRKLEPGGTKQPTAS